MPHYEIHSCEQMMELIQQLGFLPLLASGISGYSAEEMADEECRYVVFPDGGWAGRYGNGRASSSTRVIVSMASSSTARRASSVALGGRISATGAAASIPCRRMAV